MRNSPTHVALFSKQHYTVVVQLGASSSSFQVKYPRTMAELKESSPPMFKLLSWNIDGLDKRNTLERTQVVCDFINSKQPDSVYLQEVVSSTWALIIKELSSTYDCYSAVEPPAHYYPAILVRKESFSKIGIMECRDFPKSVMGRHLLQLPVSFNGVEIDLLTSHLESMRDHGYERKRQLKSAFEIMVKLQESNKTAIFAGDLNVRDNEVKNVQVPPRVVDVWEACGSVEKHKYTWDTEVNDNLDWSFGPRRISKLRFDRMYLSPSDGKLKPKVFELVGKKRLPSCGRFPSDHWGMWAEFEIV